MGTRARIEIFEDGKCIVSIYRQFDGYPSEHGRELCEFLEGKTLTNGIGSGMTGATHFNGMACLAARLVGHFKGDEIGAFYLYPAKTRDVGEEYVYRVRAVDGKIETTVSSDGDNWQTVAEAVKADAE